MNAVLQLRAECIDYPHQLDLPAVEVMMLWPDDEAARERAIEISTSQFFYGLRDHLNRDDLIALVSMFKDQPPTEELWEQARPLFVAGMRSECICAEAVGITGMGSALYLKTIRHSVCGDFGKHGQSIDDRNFQNHIWPKFRKVAHFWAATLHQQESASAPVFPCSVSQLPEFLGLAEGFRRLGEATRTRRGTQLLIHSESIQLAQGLAVTPLFPKFEIKGTSTSARN